MCTQLNSHRRIVSRCTLVTGVQESWALVKCGFHPAQQTQQSTQQTQSTQLRQETYESMYAAKTTPQRKESSWPRDWDARTEAVVASVECVAQRTLHTSALDGNWPLVSVQKSRTLLYGQSVSRCELWAVSMQNRATRVIARKERDSLELKQLMNWCMLVYTAASAASQTCAISNLIGPRITARPISAIREG